MKTGWSKRILVLLLGLLYSSAQADYSLTGKPSDPVAGRSHWAFRPLNYTVPAVSTVWAESVVDLFVEARRQQAGLTVVPDASPRDWLRRVSIQLTGLPPSFAQVRAFANDPRPDARERVVDRLLNQPEFGERWGRHWLDLARYADSNGLDENFLFREAWRYRNWVIQAINQDLPYDQFLLEQIAGDLLPYTNIEQRDRQRIASGFLVVGPKVLLGVNPKKQRMDVADEQIDTLGKAVLGMTIGCARCHDHKFDPIPTADYYALAGILTSTSVMETRHMLGQQRLMERLVGLGDDGLERDEAYEQYWRQIGKVKAAKKRAESVLEALRSDDLAGLQDLVKEHPDALANKATESSAPKTQRIQWQEAHIAGYQAVIANPPKIPARAMIPADVPEPKDEAIRRSGQFDRKGQVVPRGFLQVVGGSDSARIPGDASGRVELAQWLTDHDAGAGRLAARVMANRVWYYLFGSGLVASMDNFGRTGTEPSHPELLDYLAQRLIKAKWSVKTLVRELVLSRTFALSSVANELGRDHDPDNRWYGRGVRRRLEPEVLRDAMLTVAARLDSTPMESSVWYLGDQATAVGANKNRRRTDFPNRSVYLPMIRNDLPELFQSFDFANPHATTGARPRTLAASQGLYMLNAPLVLELAEATVRRYWQNADSPEARLTRLYRAVFAADPTRDEQQMILTYVGETEARLRAAGEDEASVHAWTLVCQALFADSRFQYLD